MKHRKEFLLLTGLVFLSCTICVGQSPHTCETSGLRARGISDFERTALRKVVAEYPSEAKQRGLAGTVRLKLFIDKAGHVRAACPVHSSRESKPDQSLIAAAQQAALQWEFPANFGLQGDHLTPDFDYVTLFVSFKFSPSASPEPVTTAKRSR